MTNYTKLAFSSLKTIQNDPVSRPIKRGTASMARFLGQSNGARPPFKRPHWLSSLTWLLVLVVLRQGLGQLARDLHRGRRLLRVAHEVRRRALLRTHTHTHVRMYVIIMRRQPAAAREARPTTGRRQLLTGLSHISQTCSSADRHYIYIFFNVLLYYLVIITYVLN